MLQAKANSYLSNSYLLIAPGKSKFLSFEEEVLAAFDGEFSSYSELALALRDDLSLKIRSIYLLPVVVFRLASKGDAEAQEILIRMGAAAGGDCAAVIKTVGMENEPCDVVLAGGMYAAARQHNPLLIDSFNCSRQKQIPIF